MKDVKIADYLWFQEGPGVRNTQYTTSGVKLINVANLVDGNVDLSTSDRYISEEEAYGKYNHFLADDGDFVIASSGIKIDYFDKKMGFIKKEHLPLCMNTSCIRFKVLDTNNLEIKYFMYYLKSNSFKKQLFNQITGSAQLNFGPSHLKKMTFPLIELKEQKRIIDRLDKTQNIINETKSLLSKYDTLIKSRFIEMFGDPSKNNKKWEIKKLGDIIRILGGYAFSSKAFKESGIPVLRIGNINSGVFRPTNMVFWDDDEKIERYAIYPSDLVMSLTGTVGKDDYGNVCILGNDYPKYYLNQRNAKLEIISDLERLYLSYLLKFPEIKSRLTNISRGIRQANIANKDIENLQIPVPPLSLQNQFAAFVQQIDKSKFEIEKIVKLVYN